MSAAFKKRLLQHRDTVGDGATGKPDAKATQPTPKKATPKASTPKAAPAPKASTPKALTPAPKAPAPKAPTPKAPTLTPNTTPTPKATSKTSTPKPAPIAPPAETTKKRKQESNVPPATTPAKQQQTPATTETPKLAKKRTQSEGEEKTPTAKKQKGEGASLTASQRRNKRRLAKKNAEKGTKKKDTTTSASTSTPTTTPTTTTTPKKSEKKTKKKKQSKTKDQTPNTPKANKKTQQASGKTSVTAKKKAEPQDWAAKASSMQDQLLGAQFRWINEKMYTCSSDDAVSMMEQDPELFDAYHKGYRAQVKKWPVNPLDLAIKLVRANPTWVVGDFGCGDGRLAESVTNKVHSFDLVASKPHITACNIAQVPLEAGVLDAAVFCLSLMGTDYMSFVMEAHRTLKLGAALIIAEVQSRFQSTSVNDFTNAVQSVGFKRESLDDTNPFFVFLTFTKSSKKLTAPAESSTAGALKACQYKKR